MNCTFDSRMAHAASAFETRQGTRTTASSSLAIFIELESLNLVIARWKRATPGTRVQNTPQFGAPFDPDLSDVVKAWHSLPDPL
jgi:hypothetical protein